MRIGTQKEAGPGKLFRFGYVILAVAACSAVAAGYAIAGQLTLSAAAAPSAASFAQQFMGITNASAKANGDPARTYRADCVRASRDHYMCPYAVRTPGARGE